MSDTVLIQERKIDFVKYAFNRKKVIIPKFMYRTDLPMQLVDESKRFFLHLQEKYGIK